MRASSSLQPRVHRLAPRGARVALCVLVAVGSVGGVHAQQGGEADTSRYADVRAALAGEAPQQALDLVEEVLPRVLVSGDPVAAARLLWLRGEALRANGQPDDALTAYERSKLFADQASDAALQALAYAGIGRALQDAERLDEAAVHFGAAADAYGRAEARALQAALLRAQSRAHLRAGDGELAREAARASARVAEAAGLLAEQAEGLRLAAATEASLDDYDEAYRTLRRAEEVQVERLEASLLEQRTDLERGLLDALGIREAERTRGDQRLSDALAAERVRWRRSLVAVIGALLGGGLLVGLAIWLAVTQQRWPPWAGAREALRRWARPAQEDAAPPAPERPAVGYAPQRRPLAGRAPQENAHGASGTSMAQRLSAAAAMAPADLAPPPRGRAEPDQDLEETGLALASFLLEQHLASLLPAGDGHPNGGPLSDGLAPPDRGTLLGRAEVLRLLRHRVAQQGTDVAMQDYVQAIADYVRLRYGSRAEGIRVHVEAHTTLRASRAAPLGLLLHELLANALRTAFVGRLDGVVEIELRRDDAYLTVRVGDDGRGLPPGFSLEQSGGGVAFIRSLAQFLRAAVELRSRDGTQWVFSVPLPSKTEGAKTERASAPGASVSD